MSTQDDKARDKAIDRVRKLLALAGNNPSEVEAASAAEKAQAILAEYNLSVAELSPAEHDATFVTDGEIRTESVVWSRPIRQAVAKLYFCGYYFSFIKDYADPKAWKNVGYRRYDRHYFVGEKHNIISAKLMSEYLVATVARLADEAAAKVPARERSRYITSFRNAAANRLSNRLSQKRQEAATKGVQTSEGKNLPALKSMYEVSEQKFKEYMDGKFGPDALDGKGRPAIISHSGGANDGHAAGNSIGLDAQVSGKGASHLLGKK